MLGRRTLEASQGPRVSEGHVASYNVIVSLPDLDEARQAIEMLSEAAIDGDKISLTGPAAREAAQEAETADADEAIFMRFLMRMAPTVVVGALLGAVVGLVVVLLTPGDTSTEELAVAIIGGVALFTLAAVLIGGVASIQPGQPWELAFHQAEGGAFVGVHSDTPDDVDRAEAIWRKHGFANIRRVDRAP
jgi:hypothetical protein